jgi:hypothetical protein
MRHLVALFVLSFANLHLRLNLVHVTCYMTSSYAIHFKGAADFGEGLGRGARRFFFTAASLRFQRSMAFSSRSSARASGFWCVTQTDGV